MQCHDQKSTEQYRKVHHDDAPVRLVHQLLQANTLVFAFAEVIRNERNAVTGGEAQDRPAQLVFAHHIPKSRSVRKPSHAMHASAEERNDKYSVHECKHAVVETEKWNEK